MKWLKLFPRIAVPACFNAKNSGRIDYQFIQISLYRDLCETFRTAVSMNWNSKSLEIADPSKGQPPIWIMLDWCENHLNWLANPFISVAGDQLFKSIIEVSAEKPLRDP